MEFDGKLGSFVRMMNVRATRPASTRDLGRSYIRGAFGGVNTGLLIIIIESTNLFLQCGRNLLSILLPMRGERVLARDRMRLMRMLVCH